MKFWKQFVTPIGVLLCICALAGGSLAGVNALTAPVIAANEAAAENAAYFEALPEADSFEPLSCTVDGVTAALKAANGAGYVFVAQSRGYGGEVPVAVAISAQGRVLRVIAMENDETPGLGQKVTEEGFCDQFSGMEAQNVTMDDIDAVSGATISSKAAVAAINLAIEAFQEQTEGGAGA